MTTPDPFTVDYTQNSNVPDVGPVDYVELAVKAGQLEPVGRWRFYKRPGQP